jgi:hypothetical protein
MQLKLFLITFALATGLMATPLTTRNTNATTTDPGNGYVQLYQEKASTGDGFLIYYGFSGNGTDTRPSEPGSPEEHVACTTIGTVTCSRSNTARNDPCDALVQELQLDYYVSVDTSPRQICYLGVSDSSSYCCVSWRNPIPGLIKGDLFDIANNSKQPFLISNSKTCKKA